MRLRLRRRPKPKPPPPSDLFTITTLMIDRRPSAWLRCAECNRLMYRDPYCSDLGILTLHWMSEHPARWLELHPEDAWFLAPGAAAPGQ